MTPPKAVFTDDDLKKWNPKILPEWKAVFISSKTFKALFSRLEAAEYIVELVNRPVHDSGSKTLDDALDAWRRSCGR